MWISLKPNLICSAILEQKTMHSLMRQKWMKLTSFVVAFGVAGTSVLAGPADEPHLNILPRTESETTRVKVATAHATDFTKPGAFEENTAGAATVRARTNADAFSQPSGNISFEGELNFKVGNGLFRKLWVSSPSSTLASDGLGPLYNARSCQRCHLKDGRGHPPETAEDSAVSMFLRISIPGDAADGIAEIQDYIATRPDPTYGAQLQDFGLAGHNAESRLQIDYEENEIALSDGEIAHLRAPTYTAADLGYGPLHPDAMLSPRIDRKSVE